MTVHSVSNVILCDEVHSIVGVSGNVVFLDGADVVFMEDFWFGFRLRLVVGAKVRIFVQREFRESGQVITTEYTVVEDGE